MLIPFERLCVRSANLLNLLYENSSQRYFRPRRAVIHAVTYVRLRMLHTYRRSSLVQLHSKDWRIDFINII
jgi:hypothetical protein